MTGLPLQIGLSVAGGAALLGSLWLWKDYGTVIALLEGAAMMCMPGL